MGSCVQAACAWRTPATRRLEGRFDLAYNAAHALALAALRWHGYRSERRYIVFQCLTHTLNLSPEQWRVLDQAHRKRNVAEYEASRRRRAGRMAAGREPAFSTAASAPTGKNGARSPDPRLRIPQLSDQDCGIP
jgi:hypothetical protein